MSLAALAWLVMLICSSPWLAILADDRLSWRCGTLHAIDLPISHMAGLRSEGDGALVKHRATFNCALIAYPNVVPDLAVPERHGGRDVMRLAHRFDDPGAFVAALSGLLAAR